MLADAIARAPDGPARWEAQYHQAYVAHLEGKKDVQNARYLATFEAIAAAGALATDLGWTVAIDLVGFLVDAKDARAVDVQHAYYAALERELGTNDPQTVAQRRKLGECRHAFAPRSASRSRPRGSS